MPITRNVLLLFILILQPIGVLGSSEGHHPPHSDQNESQHGFSDVESMPTLPADLSPDSHYKTPLPPSSYSSDGVPKGLFLNITMARGFEEGMEFRRGYHFYPVDPTEVFSTDALAVFVVFRVHKHYAPYQIIGRLYPEKVEGLSPDDWVDEDAVHLTTEDESGYLKLFPPDEGWKEGQYRVEIYVGYEVNPVNQMGTMRFTMTPTPKG